MDENKQPIDVPNKEEEDVPAELSSPNHETDTNEDEPTEVAVDTKEDKRTEPVTVQVDKKEEEDKPTDDETTKVEAKQPTPEEITEKEESESAHYEVTEEEVTRPKTDEETQDNVAVAPPSYFVEPTINGGWTPTAEATKIENKPITEIKEDIAEDKPEIKDKPIHGSNEDENLQKKVNKGMKLKLTFNKAFKIFSTKPSDHGESTSQEVTKKKDEPTHEDKPAHEETEMKIKPVSEITEIKEGKKKDEPTHEDKPAHEETEMKTKPVSEITEIEEVAPAGPLKFLNRSKDLFKDNKSNGAKKVQGKDHEKEVMKEKTIKMGCSKVFTCQHF